MNRCVWELHLSHGCALNAAGTLQCWDLEHVEGLNRWTDPSFAGERPADLRVWRVVARDADYCLSLSESRVTVQRGACRAQNLGAKIC